jgi:hypothetical protein
MEAAELLTPMKTCPDVVDCIAQDQDSLILALDSLRDNSLVTGRKRAIFKRLLPLYEALSYAKDSSVLEEGVRSDALRGLVRQSIECHEVADYILERIKLSVDDEQWEVRVAVFCEVLRAQLKNESTALLPAMKKHFNDTNRELLGRRYVEARNHYQVIPYLQLAKEKDPVLLGRQNKKVG